MTCGSNREETIMETTNKTANSDHASFDKSTIKTHQTAEPFGNKGGPLKNTEKQLMKNHLSYVRYNPWITQ
jgi:hypothetical protein